MKILIVDDHYDARKVLRYMVENNGHEAIEAENGQDALNIAKTGPPDLIISDALMPVMDGFTLLREVKQNRELCTIPIVLHSAAYKEDQDVRLAMSLGADAYIFKPVDPVELWKKIEGILEKAKQKSTHPTELIKEDAEYLKRYSEVVATKLEEKVLELEKTLAERDHAEKILKQQEVELTKIFENAPFMMMLLDGDHCIRRVNALACTFTGLSVSDMIGKRAGNVLNCVHSSENSQGCGFGPNCQQCPVIDIVKSTSETGQGHHQIEARLTSFVDSKEHCFNFLISTARIIVEDSPLVLVSFQDLTEYKKLEEQFHQAQKMEAVGTLAGGVAHDFNNMLGVILGHADLASEILEQYHPIQSHLEEIVNTAEHSTKLIRQLLAFARRQTVVPKVLDLNETVEGMIKILQRLIGEDIDLSWKPEAEVCQVKIDPSQIDQIMANLCVNARDAIEGVGKINIKTYSVASDTAFCEEHPDLNPDEYVGLTVCDDGCGMNEETLEKLFVPFFTTKEIGKGTGLGLATVYGIVKQNTGFINVSSKPEIGTTFKIYLPRYMGRDEDVLKNAPRDQARGGDETILVVEDEPALLEIIKLMLKSLGYTVLASSKPGKAIHLMKHHPTTIHLFLTDVILPELNGRELGEKLVSIYPDLKVLLMSGYTGDLITRRGELDEGINFIQKPFSKDALAAKVRDVLDSTQVTQMVRI